MLKYIVMGLMASPAYANCAQVDVVFERLTGQWGEHEVMNGLNATETHVVTTLVNPETGSWSIVMHDGNGKACLVASGSAGSVIPLPPQL
jgi:hypothetical protein